MYINKCNSFCLLLGVGIKRKEKQFLFFFLLTSKTPSHATITDSVHHRPLANRDTSEENSFPLLHETTEN